MWRPWGRFRCGIADLELARPEAEVSIAGRLYYPAAQAPEPSGAAWLRPWAWRLPGIPWLEHSTYAQGLAKFLFIREPESLKNSVLKRALAAVASVAGKAQRMGLSPGAPLAPAGCIPGDAPDKLPLVLFSHGLAGTRFMYSILCSELASQGYLVLALEHGDGTACAAKLPGGRGWLPYQRLGDDPAVKAARTKRRLSEMKAALELVQSLNAGESVPGAALSHGLQPAAFLRGRVDLRCVAAVGHSYGGGTCTALVAEDARFSCAAVLDPWWPALYDGCKALSRFEARTPLLILPSHNWAIPDPGTGLLGCDSERREHERVLAAAAAVQQGGQRLGGALLLSIAGSSHNTFADVLPLFVGAKAAAVMDRLGLAPRLDAQLGIALASTAVLAFLSRHLPLTEQQRAAQSWQPGSVHAALDRVLQRDAADAAGGAAAAAGRPLAGLVAASDRLVDRMGSALPAPAPSHGHPAGAAGDGGDVATAAEVAEAALPSAASGSHRAPDAQPPERAPLSSAQRAALQAGLNTRFSPSVEAEEVEEMRALLGDEHIYKISSY